MAAEDDGDRAARGTPLVEAVELLGVQGATRWAVMHSENDLGRQLRSLESVEVSDDVDFLPLRNEMFPAERMRKSEYSNAMPNVN